MKTATQLSFMQQTLSVFYESSTMLNTGKVIKHTLPALEESDIKKQIQQTDYYDWDYE